ncbi:hypothetical protein BD289DRAFT_436031 [Coniella lustricola]|uniref:Zn(2)-C6 fungal-type domain-containing protein n=1 Tax=Coniella lustricola TaxID=2025994 RepID=A0A2T3A5R3_9PEZI|nr:hypothetical protein BD289DRAFT_436031 [Coniella lustricola]
MDQPISSHGSTSAQRTSAPRKKACQGCTVARARCDLVRPSCSRCLDRHIHCEYLAPAAAGARLRKASRPSAASHLAYTSPAPTPTRPSTSAVTSSEIASTSYNGPAFSPTPPTSSLVRQDGNANDALGAAFDDNTTAMLLAPLDVSHIRDRWLDYYFTPTTKQIKEYPARVAALMAKTMASYSPMWIRSQAHSPPFIHPAQLQLGAHHKNMPEPLANCLSLLRLCQNAAPGSHDLVRESIHREMERLVASVGADTQNMQTLQQHLMCLSALQAYFLLSLHSYRLYKTQPDIAVFGPDNIATLHDLASKVSAAGVLCPEEVGGASLTGGAVPHWESWIIAEAKRRTIFCVYMFEDVYNYENHCTTYLAEELAPLLAPSSKWLWQARDRASFEAEYAHWTRAWSGQRGLAISELWPQVVSDKLDEAIQTLRKQETEERIARWTEDVDEFGMFLLAVCTTTHNS